MPSPAVALTPWLPACRRGRDEIFVLGGVSPKPGNDPKAFSDVIPYVAKLEAGSLQELWRRNLTAGPLSWR